jgi:hypothetical protein
MLALIPFFAGCDEERANSATVTNLSASPPPISSPALGTNQSAPAPTNQASAEATDEELANAPGKIISTPEGTSTNVSNNPRLNDFVKLVQAGLGESVLMAYVTNSPTPFSLSSDDILYLNDLGTPETVVTAMLQRDQYFNSNSAMAPTAPISPQTQTAYANPTPAPGIAEPYTDQNASTQVVENVPPLTPSPAIEDAEQAPNASYSYFYDSLSPYGNWIDIDGYGPCWQPTAVVVNPGWQPYCDRGHWAYTDCGWCWASDYSWGWAPFHYGRWFHHDRWGWCWAPDTTWGPAWVSWRYNDAYCGWAPLPPTACYRPGFGFTYFGRSVGFNFGFGLSANRFVFVPLDHFHDRFPDRYRLPHQEVTRIYNRTTVQNQIIRGNNHMLIDRGIPVDRVAAASHTEIHPIHIRTEADAPRAAELGRDGRSLSVYRPALPTQRLANNPRMVGEGVAPDPHFDLRSRVDRTPVMRPSLSPSAAERRPIISNPTAMAPSLNPGRENRFSQSGGEPPGSLIMRGPNRANPYRDENSGQIAQPNFRNGRVLQPETPAPQPGILDNRRAFTPQQNLAPPTFNRPLNDFSTRSLESPQRNFQPQQPAWPRQDSPWPRQEAPRTFGTPRMNDQNINHGFRSEPAAPAPEPRAFESRPAPEVRSAPPQYSAPARQESGQGGGRGNGGNWGGGGGGWNGNGGGRGNR